MRTVTGFIVCLKTSKSNFVILGNHGKEIFYFQVFKEMEGGLTDKEIASENGLGLKRGEKIKSRIRTRLKEEYKDK